MKIEKNKENNLFLKLYPYVLKAYFYVLFIMSITFPTRLNMIFE